MIYAARRIRHWRQSCQGNVTSSFAVANNQIQQKIQPIREDVLCLSAYNYQFTIAKAINDFLPTVLIQASGGEGRDNRRIVAG
jgi:hypothetical protein